MEHKRTLRLSHEAIELIETALSLAGNKGLQIAGDLKSIKKDSKAYEVLEVANKYFDLLEWLKNGELDI